MKIAIASDHGGFDLKTQVLAIVESKGHDAADQGCASKDSCDYPDYAKKVTTLMLKGEVDEGILICTTGIGMSIAANRTPGIRAALCLNSRMASTARLHNNANILVLAASEVDDDKLSSILDAWFTNEFCEVERHSRRVQKLDE
jgi:ribose 5-phosphate isomerase B